MYVFQILLFPSGGHPAESKCPVRAFPFWTLILSFFKLFFIMYADISFSLILPKKVWNM